MLLKKKETGVKFQFGVVIKSSKLIIKNTDKYSKILIKKKKFKKFFKIIIKNIL